MTAVSWVPLATAALASGVALAFVRPLLQRLGVIDEPNARSSHVVPTIRGGGLGPLLGLIVGAASAALAVPSALPVIISGAVAVAFGLLGLAEDVRGLPVPLRGGLQVVFGVAGAAALAAALGQPLWTSVVFGVLIAVYVNVTNFMDGVNGISGMHGIVAGLSYAAIAAVVDVPWIVYFGLLVAFVFAPFLPWNLSRSGLFLGDVGSYLLGAAVALLAIGSAMVGVPVVTVLAPVLIYLVDTMSTLLRRGWRGEPVLRAHRTHVYQRLTDTGLSHVQAAAIVSILTAVSSLIGLSVIVFSVSWVVAVIALAALSAFYVAWPRIRGNVLPRPAGFGLPAVELEDAPGPELSSPPHVWAVVGASGFVGSGLVRHLKGRGYDVREISAPRLTLDPSTRDLVTLENLAASSLECAELVGALSGADIVVNAAGLASPDSAGGSDLYGANALLPVVFAHAAHRAGAARAIHLSSAAVQGRRSVLDESIDASPFSYYSHSKALGERAFLHGRSSRSGLAHTVLRATSVQGAGRSTTESFVRIARSPLASVAGAGEQPTVVSTIDGLVAFIADVAASSAGLRPVLLQPWEGHSAAGVLELARGSSPRHLPRWLCVALLACARSVGRIVPEIAGAGRRLELMWMGQAQDSSHPVSPGIDRSTLATVFAGVDQ